MKHFDPFASRLLVVMYHYVRPLATSSFPAIKGLDNRMFRSQIDTIRRSHRIVGLQEFLYLYAEEGEATEPVALLTFDDGFKDHIDYVVPVLLDAEVTGVFFASSAPVLERRVLDVHRAHFILAAAGDVDHVAAKLDSYASELDSGFNVARARAMWSVPNDLDTAEVVYVKRMLQRGLGVAARSEVSARLFSDFVQRDEVEFVSDLYCSLSDLQQMHSAGMDIGAHGRLHHWMSDLTIEGQLDEIDAGLALLSAVCGRVPVGWSMAFPYGDWTDETIALMQERGCVAAFTTIQSPAEVGARDPLRIPRFDTVSL